MDQAHRERARHLTGRVPAHPVGHDRERELLVDEEIVFVQVANAALIRRREVIYGFLRRHEAEPVGSAERLPEGGGPGHASWLTQKAQIQQR